MSLEEFFDDFFGSKDLCPVDATLSLKNRHAAHAPELPFLVVPHPMAATYGRARPKVVLDVLCPWLKLVSGDISTQG